MLEPESVAKGCFAFRPKLSPGKKRNKQPKPNPLKLFSDEIWHQSFRKVWSEIENKLESLEDDVTEGLLNDVLAFISSSKCTHQIPTAAILTGINLPDHGVLFGRLFKKIKNNKTVTHSVAVLSSSDCLTIKHAVERTVSHLISGQKCEEDNFEINEEEDSDEDDEGEKNEKVIKKSACTLPVLLDWYNKNNVSPSKKPKLNKQEKGKLVIILKDFERISAKVLHDFIHILSAYVDRLPLVLVLGIATKLSCLSDILNHSTTSRLSIKSFHSQPSVYFLNNTLNKVFLSPECPFQLSGKLFKFFTNVFLFYDFSVNRFTQGIKYCVMDHFREGGNVVSLLCCSEEDLESNFKKMTHGHLEELRMIKSFKVYRERLKDKDISNALCEDDEFTKKEVFKLIKKLRNTIKEFYISLAILRVLVSQLPGVPLGIHLRELYEEAMTREITKTEIYKECRQLLEFQAKDQLIKKIDQILTIMNENKPFLQSERDELLHLRDQLNSAGLHQIKKSPVKMEIKKRSQLKMKVIEMGSTNQTEFEQIRNVVLDKIMYEILGKYLQPPNINSSDRWCLFETVILIETEARHRVVPRIRAPIHVALNNPNHYLQCECCKVDSDDQILPTMPDICIVYKLHLESGCLINMYDWLQSFNLIVNPKGSQGAEVEQKIQARFTQAVAELEFLGFIKSSKRKTDHMERLTWGGGPLQNAP